MTFEEELIQNLERDMGFVEPRNMRVKISKTQVSITHLPTSTTIYRQYCTPNKWYIVNNLYSNLKTYITMGLIDLDNHTSIMRPGWSTPLSMKR